VARAGDEAEDLRARVEEVEDLGDEKKAERLGEMAENTDNGEDHAGEVAVGVADKDLGRVPVVVKQSAGDTDPREEEVKREEMRVSGWVGVRGEEVEAIVKGDEEGDDDALGNFDAVDTREHVDALWAEHGDAGHVDVVEETKVNEVAEVRLKLDWEDDGSDVEVDKVDDEERDGSQTRNPPFVSPSDIEEVVADA
jgi:hypothetical protein